MSLLAGIVSIAAPVAGRVLAALGLSVLTIGGVAVSVSAIKDNVIAALGQAPLAALQLAGILGLWTAGGMVFGAMTWAVSYWALTRAVRFAGVGGG